MGYLEEAKAEKKENPELAFFIATKPNNLTRQIRPDVGLENIPLGKYHKPLEKKEKPYEDKGMGPNYCCNSCGGMGDEEVPVSMHNAEDHFDLCLKCYAKIYPPTMIIIDVPNANGYFQGPTDYVTEEDINYFIQDWKNGKLENRIIGVENRGEKLKE